MTTGVIPEDCNDEFWRKMMMEKLLLFNLINDSNLA